MGNKLVTSFAPVVLLSVERPPNRLERKAAIESPRVERGFFQLVTELRPQTLGWSLNNRWKGHVFTKKGHKELPRGRLLARFDLIHVSSLQHHKNLDGWAWWKKWDWSFHTYFWERIIPIGKWFASPPSISHKKHDLEGEKTLLCGLIKHGSTEWCSTAHGGEGTHPRLLK